MRLLTIKEQLILKKIEKLEKHQKEQDEKITYVEDMLKMLTDGTV